MGPGPFAFIVQVVVVEEVVEELMPMEMKKDAPACCAILLLDIMTLPSVNVRCCQSGIFGSRG